MTSFFLLKLYHFFVSVFHNGKVTELCGAFLSADTGVLVYRGYR